MSQTYDVDVRYSPVGRRDRLLPCTTAPCSFLSNLEWIAEVSHIPTVQDVLQRQMPVAGNKDRHFSVQDVKVKLL